MKPHDLERKYQPHLKRVSNLVLLPASEAINLLEDAKTSAVRLLGVEAFRISDDGGVQPSLEFSNVCYGTAHHDGTQFRFEPELRPRDPWNKDPELLIHTQQLIRDGAAHGYAWYEVSLEDLSSERLLFFGEEERSASA
jgi:hypothetical protein